VSAAPPSPDTTAYVAERARHQERERFLASLFAPPHLRRDLWALYAFNAEVARIPDTVSEPLLGRMKLQWWRDTLAAIAAGGGGPVGHPLAQALATTMRSHRLDPSWIADLLAAREAELDGWAWPDAEAMVRYADATAVRLAWLALEILGVRDDVSRDAARHAAVGHAVAGLLRAVPFHAAHGRIALPQDYVAAAGLTVQGLQDGSQRRPLRDIAVHMAAQAHVFIAGARAIAPRADARAWPVLLWAACGRHALDRLTSADYDVFDARMMRYRPSVAPLLWKSWRRRL
jgi:phytoene synthase